MHYLKKASLIAESEGIPDPKNKITKKHWPNDQRNQNINNMIADRTDVKDYIIQSYCDEFDLEITFSPNNEPKVKKHE